MARPTIKSLEDLREWFFDKKALSEKGVEPSAVWSIHYGETKTRHRLAEQNNADMEFEDSWDILEKNLLRLNGRGKVCISMNVFNNKNQMGAHEAIYEYGPYQETGRAGINGIGGSYIGAPEVEAYVQKEIQREREKWEQDQRIAALEAELHENTPLMDRLLEENFDQVAGIATQLLQGLIQKKPAVAVSGFEQKSSPEAGEKESPAAPTTQAEAADRINKALNRLSFTFPNVIELLEGLADFVESQPDLAKSLFENQILKQ